MIVFYSGAMGGQKMAKNYRLVKKETIWSYSGLERYGGHRVHSCAEEILVHIRIKTEKLTRIRSKATVAKGLPLVTQGEYVRPPPFPYPDLPSLISVCPFWITK